MENLELFICEDCGKECETVMTISDWCDEKGLNDEMDYLYNLADRQNFSTKICEDCFDSLVASAGI